MSTGQILVEKEGVLGWIRINRPERLNAFAGTMRADILAGLEDMERDDSIRCVIIAGAGRAFSTGGDIAVMAEIIEANDEARFENLVRTGARVVARIDSMTKPVIAAINGPAAGAGACLALACDMRVASATASIGMTFLRVGLNPDWGGSYFLPHLVGPAAAAEAIFTGGMINAERCERLGLFNRVVPASDLDMAVRGLAGQISAGPARVIADTRRALRHATHGSLADVLEMEVEAQMRAFRSADFREGIRAFLEKRTARFNRKVAGSSRKRKQ